MGGISSGVGLISGIDTRTLIQQLLSLEAQPRVAAQQRSISIQRQSAAYLDVNTSLLALKQAAAAFDSQRVFRASSATSSDADVLTASAGTTAARGTYQFRVHRLVSTQQSLSRGFVDRDTSAVGASSFTFEVGGGALTSETRLSDLNGSAGVSRGSVQITDRRGGTALIDLSTAVTIQDVVDAINGNSAIDVTASIDGDRLKLTDITGVNGTLTVANGSGYTTADSLGIAGTASGAGSSVSLNGTSIRTLSGATALSALNDGNGVHIRDGSADIVIKDRRGATANIELGLKTHVVTDPVTQVQTTVVDQARATTLQDVINYINTQAQAQNVNVTASLNSEKTGIVITDTTAPGDITANLIVSNGISGRTAASDLGILTDAAGVASSSVAGKRLISSLNSTLTRNLRGGSGIVGDQLTVTDRGGNSKTITLSQAAREGSVNDLISEINTKLADTGGGQPLVRVTFGLNRSGNGFAVTDTTASGSVTGNLIIAGSASGELGVATTGDADGLLQAASSQSKWFSLATNVSSLNAGKGIGTGTFRITDSQGRAISVEIGSNIKTVDDLIVHIKSRPATDGIEVRINGNGDGLEIRDIAGGAGRLKIEDVSGTVAKSLNLVGEAAAPGAGSIDGSFERRVTFTATDTLDAISTKINAAGVGVRAAIIRDGSGSSPFRLSFTAAASGQVGRAIIDTGALDLGLQSLSRGDDAVVFFGAGDPARAVLLTGSTNTLDQAVQGVSIDLKSASTRTVDLTVTRDTEAVETAIADFVDAYNDVLKTIDKYDTFNADTNVRGLLLGDTTADRIRSQLYSTIQGNARGVSGSFQRLFQVGVKIGSGAKLEFDSERFRAALESNPENVEQLFTANQRTSSTRREIAEGIYVTENVTTITALGVAEQIEELTTSFTNSTDGLITRRNQNLATQKQGQDRLIESIDSRLERKRLRLEKQFVAMEQALAQLQSQQSSIGRLG